VFIICPFLRLTGDYKQKILEIDDLYTRIVEVLKLIKLRREYERKLTDTTKLKDNTHHIIDKFFSKNTKDKQNENLIKKKGNTNNTNIIEELEKKLDSIQLPEEARTIAQDELMKLKSSEKNNPEQEWTINYLKTFLKLPWDQFTKDNEDLQQTKNILDRDHFGLDKVKKRILEYLSVRKLNSHSSQGRKKGSILCFNGPPGVGKTSLAKSIADSLGKKFYRLSLGGVRDESEIRGHRRTYIASMPGMLIQALIRVQTKNPVILLDEIDKLGTHFKGDVSSSLLEVLDPEQNASFKDHYINTAFDLSEVFFICTSNYLENLSPPLRDRLEIIDIPGYTIQEKVEICKRYLIPKQMSLAGLQSEKLDVKVVFSDLIIDSLVVNYTWESGVRQLERNISSVTRYIASLVVEEMQSRGIKLNNENDVITKHFEKVFEVNDEILKICLGRKVSEVDLTLRTSNPGVAIGLAYTLNGGAITLIESTKFQGRGELLVTGNMGDIMKESLTTGLSWIKSNKNLLGLENFDFSSFNLHVHLPQAAVPKDGPSAGITMAISIVSYILINEFINSFYLIHFI
jgi:ATP-dependent Lon protease